MTASPRASTLACLLLALAVLAFWDGLRHADPDLFVTLYAGEEIVARGEVPRVDSASFSVPGGEWMDYEWAARVLYYLAWEHLGSAGLILLRDALGALLLALLLVHGLRRQAGPVAFAVAMLVLGLGIRDAFWFRPRVFTFAGLALLFTLIDRSREQPRWLFAIPVWIAVWVNLHGGAALGVVLVGIFAGESVATALYRRLTGRPDASLPQLAQRPAPGVAAALACFGASVLASGLHPFGFHNWLAVGHTLTQTHTTPLITEWRSITSYPLAQGGFYLGVMTLAGVALVLGRRRVTLFEALSVVVLGAAGFQRVRFLHLFVISSAWMLLSVLPALREPLAGRLAGLRERVPAPMRPWAAVGFAGATLLAVAWFETPGDLAIHKWEAVTPVRGVAFLERNGIGGRILNEYDWGGYIHFRMPEARIFVDGRSDTVYPADVLLDWVTFVTAGPGWRDIPRRYDADVIFIRRMHPVAAVLAREGRWPLAWADDVSAVFLRDTRANAPHLERLRRGALEAPEVGPEDYLLEPPPGVRRPAGSDGPGAPPAPRHE